MFPVFAFVILKFTGGLGLRVLADRTGQVGRTLKVRGLWAASTGDDSWMGGSVIKRRDDILKAPWPKCGGEMELGRARLGTGLFTPPGSILGAGRSGP